MQVPFITITTIILVAAQQALSGDKVTMDAEFEKLGEQYIEQFTAFSPVRATDLGDHRFDDQLDDISDEARTKQAEWIRGLVTRLDRIETGGLSRRNQVDYALLKHALAAQL
ncbi:MAG: DUF885 family protein [Planctomycetales bacterium]|jgi:uncharacterized protein (DUF885 family)